LIKQVVSLISRNSIQLKHFVYININCTLKKAEKFVSVVNDNSRNTRTSDSETCNLTGECAPTVLFTLEKILNIPAVLVIEC